MEDEKTKSLVLHTTFPYNGITISVDAAPAAISFQFEADKPAKVVEIPADLARPMANLALHRCDLLRTRMFLMEVDKQGLAMGQAVSTVCIALWQAALISTFKCFQGSVSRPAKLDADTIFGVDATQPNRAAFDHLKAMRNKHIAHDENDWLSPQPIAVVREKGLEPKVDTIDCLVIEGMDIANIRKLAIVTEAALTWVVTELEKEREAVRVELLSCTWDDLMALPRHEGSTPYTDSVNVRRR